MVNTLQRLAGLDTGGLPVLTMYVDLDPSRFPTPGARHAQITSLLASARRRAEEIGHGPIEGLERVAALLEEHFELARGGLAVFVAGKTQILEVVRLPESVEPMVAIDARPWLEPLASALTGGDWVVALVSRTTARIFRGGPHSLVELGGVTDYVHGRHSQGGWSQSRYQRGINGEVSRHLQHTVQWLQRAHERRPFEHLVVAASDEVWPELVDALPRPLRDRVTGRVPLDVELSAAQDVLRAVAPVVDRVEGDRERALLAQVESRLATGGAAAAGPDEVLAMLAESRVAVLLVAHGADIPGRACPDCGYLSASRPTCPNDGSELLAVDAVERAVDAAVRQGAEVLVVRHEVDALRGRGSMAALLRY